MGIQKDAIFLTGEPGIGKSTTIQTVINKTKDCFEGFYTREIRKGNLRVGFELVGLHGETSILATKDIETPFKKYALFGNYKVNITAIEEIAIPSILLAKTNNKIAVIDEVGPMEIISDQFCEAVTSLLADKTIILGAIVQRPYKFADWVKSHPRVVLISIMLENRDEVSKKINEMLKTYLPK